MSTALCTATLADLPALAELNRLVYSREPLAEIVFLDWPNPATQLPYYTSLLQDRFRDPRTEVLKITDAASGAILASVCWTLVTGDAEASGIANTTLPAGVNVEFIGKMVANIRKVDALIAGRKHFTINSLFVAEDQQEKGLASQMMRACLAKADEAELPTYLVSFPGAHSFYYKFGFKDVGTLDIEMKDAEEGGRDLGLYESYAMLRE
ncbi:hypothetical protein MMC17_003843 [Xylographa soralifera]|nr:hypothetical protein [Xylographa soralifera]